MCRYQKSSLAFSLPRTKEAKEGYKKSCQIYGEGKRELFFALLKAGKHESEVGEGEGEIFLFCVKKHSSALFTDIQEKKHKIN